MAYNGDSKKIVSSSFLYTTLQSFYTKIKGLLDNKADKDHSHEFNATDADKLDGYHASDLVLLQHFIAGKLSSKAVYYSNTVGKDCDEIEDFLALAGGADGLHYPAANTYYYILTFKYSDTAKKQIAFGYKGTASDNIVFRTCNDGTWSNWKGINADTLDGLHASNFVKLGYGATTNWDTLVDGGMYRMDDISGQTSRHNEMASYGQLLVIRGTGDTICQIFCNYANNKIFSRTANGVGGTQVNWTSWKKINDGGNAETATTATTSSFSQNLNSTGFGNGTLTYVQTSGDFYDNTGWCHYLIANHGNGETYYNHTIALPFWDVPMYQRQEGNTSSRRGWQKFYTTENITHGTSALTPGSSTLKSGHIYLQYE